MSIETLLLGRSALMQQLRARITRMAATDMSVMIEGPTGSGKELVALALHQGSMRTGEWVAANVCAIADGVFENTLFGHARGAFTGAVSDHAGLLTEAHRGTIFLDEIGGLGLIAQAKLLRAIETRRFRPVGGKHDQLSDFRVVAASNVSLDELIHRGEFRHDLAERLRAVRISVPGLAARDGDALILAEHFASERGCRLSTCARRFIAGFAWPGNVRQLRNAIDCSAHLVDHALIDEVALRESLHDLPAVPTPSLFESAARTPEDRATIAAVQASKGNVDKAALLLSIHRTTLYRRLQRIYKEGNTVHGGKFSSRSSDVRWRSAFTHESNIRSEIGHEL